MNPSIDTQEIRTRARQHIEEGAVTERYRADREAVVAMLNSALATEIVCQLRYKRHHSTAQGLASEAVAKELLAHAQEEGQHADWLAARIVQIRRRTRLLAPGPGRAQPRRIHDRQHPDRDDQGGPGQPDPGPEIG